MIHAGTMPRITAISLTTLTVLMLGSAGCQPSSDPRLRTLHQKVDSLTSKNQCLNRQLAAQDATIEELQEQVETLAQLPNRLDHLFTVDRIKLASLTGGADYDDTPGDDGITVYLRPLDDQGHVLKAAGRITIELLDLNVPGSPKSLGKYVHDEPDQLRQLWHGGLLTNHYTIKCPWDSKIGPPSCREVTIRATFTDFLTGRRFSATRVVEIATSPSTDP